MLEKSKDIKRIVKQIDDNFGVGNFIISDQWDCPNNIGLQRKNKLIYIAFYNKDDYFFECELLSDDPEIYTVQNSDNATGKQLLEAISKFFCIERIIKQV